MEEKKLLIVVDMQYDFIDGSLGTDEAKAIVPKVVEKIQKWDGHIIFTLDAHNEHYLETNEGKHLPVKHCILGTDGQGLNYEVGEAILQKPDECATAYMKNIFACRPMIWDVMEGTYTSIEIVGLCTDVCVLANAIMLRTFLPDIDITVDATCCAGTTVEKHKSAIDVLQSCAIDVITE
jgi:nicotinamidase-related amidase